MSEEKNTLKILDETISAVENISPQLAKINEALKTAKEELMQLEKDKSVIGDEKKKLEQEKTQLELDKTHLEAETHKLEKEKQEKDVKIGAMSGEQMKLLEEYERLKVDLAKFAKIAEESQDSKFDFERIQALISIYAVLIEKIWQGQPHYRILMTLHGDKEVMTRDEIKNTTGIGGAFVLRAVQELAKVNLVEYNMDTSTVKLKQRLYEKKAMEEKK